MSPTKRTSATEPTDGFAELKLDADLRETLKKLDFHTPTDIQREMIPHALQGKDCLGQAKTGTGKTAAFALPMLQNLTPGESARALVLVPTRELASQVDDHVRMLGKRRALKTVLVYGGRRIRQQIEQLKKGPEIVIGTPGRVLDLMRRKTLDLSQVKLAILDEVDRMLDIGFRDDIRRILRSITSKHQTIFVSATIDEDIRKLAHSFMHDPVEVNVSRDALTVEGIEHGFVTVDPRDKFQTLLGLLKHESPTLAIVFTNTKHAARRVAERLKRNGVSCLEIHGDLMQSRRERVMSAFRKGQIQVLVATDLASRGLDVMEVSHIINYDIPEEASAYVHRIGRTARMGQSGYAVTFVTREQGSSLTEIEKLINYELPRFEAPWVIQREPEPPPEDATADQPASAAPVRYRETLRRNDELEALGVRPQHRTLGSRFRSTRRRRFGR
ncbi:MAG: DEAD/DEAH box helicase [Planctomycetes bacterium]|nr:DEAD/DEAH box helicase [Planctomycetota bacterium]